jgi:orotidine-5'-phosphate decarboxylase
LSAPAPTPRDRLIVALDLSDVKAAEAMVVKLGEAVSFYKIGFELALSGGIPLARALAGAGKQVFLDLKLHDIANTVARATARAAELGATFLTVHAFAPTMRAAVEGRSNTALKILAVTVLTSWDDDDLRAAGYTHSVPDLVRKRAQEARTLGIDGLVASAAEAADLRKKIGAILLVTPGIRPAGEAAGDQKRVVTPTDAIRAGADYLVVGRPILAARDPKAAAEAIVGEISKALK